ncbi:hypothetical protein CP533_3158 [Ophiocordyceps camponoti-saundersi (nom. inval.)]|nr:hypothetical protein CP533_3158 [Ophiocordyceps camponoti-saundersi (nom. inval.)]
MPPRRRAEASESQDYHELGHRGRKTGISLPDGGERDEHGMQPLDNLFSSPSKPPVVETNGNHDDSGSEDMDISSSEHRSPPVRSSSALTTADPAGGFGSDTLLKNQRNPKLAVPRSRSPIKTTLGSPPRKNPHLPRPPSPERADESYASRSMEFDANTFDESSLVAAAQSNGFATNGLGDGSLLDLANTSVEQSVLLLDAVNRQEDSAISFSQEQPEQPPEPEEPPAPVRRKRGRPRRQDRPQEDVPSSQPNNTKRRSSRTSLTVDDIPSQEAPAVQDQRKTKRQRTKGPGALSAAAPLLPPPQSRPPPAAAQEETTEIQHEEDVEEALDEEVVDIRQKHMGRRQKQAEMLKKETKKKHAESHEEDPEVSQELPEESQEKPTQVSEKHSKRQNKRAETRTTAHAEARQPQAEPPKEHEESQREEAKTQVNKAEMRKKRADTHNHAEPQKKTSADQPEPEDEQPKPRRRGRPSRKDKVGEASFMALQRGPPMPKSRGLVSVRHDDESMTQTRSGRHSYRPVAYWRGEQVISVDEEQQDMFNDRGGFVMPTIKEVVRVPPEEPFSKRSHHRSAGGGGSGKAGRPKSQQVEVEEEEKEEWEAGPPGIITAEVVVWEPEHEEHPPVEGESVQVMNDRLAISAGAIQTSDIKDATFRFAKTLTMPFMGSGVVDLPPGAEKRAKNSRKMHMVFFVHYGKVLVNINETEFRITTGGTWFVPRGNYYSIRNDYDRPSRIFFAQACEVQPPRTDERHISQEEVTPT